MMNVGHRRWLWLGSSFAILLTLLGLQFSRDKPASMGGAKSSHDPNYLLMEAEPHFAGAVRLLLRNLQSEGQALAIKEVFRSSERQDSTVQNGSSEVRRGRHNEVGPDGAPLATAVDLEPPQSLSIEQRTKLAYTVACDARHLGMETGILWGLSGLPRALVDKAVDSCQIGPLSIGWDPFHIQWQRQCHAPPDSAVWARPQGDLGPDQEFRERVRKARSVVVFHDPGCALSSAVVEDLQAQMMVRRERRKIIVIEFTFDKSVGAEQSLISDYCNRWRSSALRKSERERRIIACVNSPRVRSLLRRGLSLGELLGLQGTPTVFEDGVRYEGIPVRWASR